MFQSMGQRNIGGRISCVAILGVCVMELGMSGAAAGPTIATVAIFTPAVVPTTGVPIVLTPPTTRVPTTTQVTTTTRVPTTTQVVTTATGVAATTAPATTVSRATVPVAQAPTATVTTTIPERPKPAYVDKPVGARQKAAAYAYTWALSTNTEFALFYRGRISVPSDLPEAKGRAIDTVTQAELDCTSFMSQALRVSGFDYTKTWRYDPVRHFATTSWVRASGPQGLSSTFVKLGRMKLMTPVGARYGDPPPPGIQLGDIVVWDLNDRRGKMNIDHQLMVTEVSAGGLSWADIRVSYHTYDHRNRAMNEYQDFVHPDAPNARLYAFRVNYPS